MTQHDFQPGSTWVYGPVDNPTYVRFLKRAGGLLWSAISGGRKILFDPTLHHDIREAGVVLYTKETGDGATLIESYYADPLLHEPAVATPPPEPTHKLNTDRTVAVATDYYWNEDMRTCPLGAKVQLLGVGGVASYGNYNGRDPFWVAWAPLPKRRTT